jgi:hypothetical protein
MSFPLYPIGPRGGNVQGDPKQCRKTNIPKSATNAAGSEMSFLSVCGMIEKYALPTSDPRHLQNKSKETTL